MAWPIQVLATVAMSRPDPAARLHGAGQDSVGDRSESRIDATVHMAMVATAGSLVAAAIGGAWPVAVVLGSVALVVSVAVRFGRRRRSQNKLKVELPAALDSIARSLRTGSTLRLAIADATDRLPPGLLRAVLAQVGTEAERGQSLDRALIRAGSGIAGSHGSAELATALASLAVIAADDVGSARAVERCGRAVRDQINLTSDVRSMIAQAELSMWILVLLPIGFLAAAGQSTLFTSGFGRVCLVAGLGFDAAGLVWMRAMVAGVGR